MLSAAVRSQASEAIEARFGLRDEMLEEELSDLAAKFNRKAGGEEPDRVGVRLRLICEQDLYERAQLAWAALRKAHQDQAKGRKAQLQKELLDELDRHMRAAAVNLAQRLRAHADDLAFAFAGSQAIDVEWIARLRERAFERQAQQVEDYVLRRDVSRPGR